MKLRRTVLLALALLTFAPLVAAQESDGAGGDDNDKNAEDGDISKGNDTSNTVFNDCMTDCRSGDHPNCTGICNLEAGKGCSFAIR